MSNSDVSETAQSESVQRPKHAAGDALSNPSQAPGWRGNWLNGWLASLGAVSTGKVTLRFEHQGFPVPVFGGSADPFAEVAVRLPTVEQLHASVIVRHGEVGELPRNPTMAEWSARAAVARRSGDLMLGATITDLTLGATERLDHSPFDPTVPKGLTLFERVVTCRQALEESPVAQVLASAVGDGERIMANGLGFDATRITIPAATNSSKYVDPVVECLAFESLRMFPVRGRVGRAGVTRLWNRPSSQRGAFAWPIWEHELDWYSIDALLDRFAYRWNQSNEETRTKAVFGRDLAALGVTAVYESVPYKPTGQMDSTRGYSATLAWNR